MSIATLPPTRRPVVYPESDGKPMAENTEQFDYITLIKLGLEAMLAERPDVFIAGDLFWYPEEGNNKVVTAPDVLVAFGRPKGRRGSYLQWVEGDIAPQVVFEIMSPSNTKTEMDQKLAWYGRHGVEEYYVYDPDDGELKGYQRSAGSLARIPKMRGWISPRLATRFELDGKSLELYGPDGRRFQHYVDVVQQLRWSETHSVELKEAADLASQQAKAEWQRAEAERQRAEAERERADAVSRQNELLAAKLRELGIDPANL